MMHSLQLKSKILGILVLPLAMGSFSFDAKAQTLAETKAFYENGEYQKALPGLRRLVETNPRNQTYALWYGKALNNLGQYDKALAPLKIAAKKAGEAQLLYADALYHNYDFEAAKDEIEAYSTYLKRTKRSREEANAFDNRLSRASSMLDRVARVEVIDSIVLPKELLLSAYKISQDAGQLSRTSALIPQETNSAAISYINSLGDRRILALSDENGQLKLYGSNLVGSKWSSPQPLSEAVNKTGTENYPFLKQDGSTLLFARNTEDGLGGLDLYMTRRNASGEYLDATPLGMPFNSPYNDYMIAYDESTHLGYFASDRFQPMGSVCIYTFIIDENEAVVPTNDLAEKVKWASLKSIAATQEKGTDYSKYKNTSVESTKARNNNQNGVRLSVNGRLYTDWSDFKSSEAGEIYKKLLEKKSDLDKLSDTLQTLRRAYREASPSEKNSLKAKILNLEENQESLRLVINELFKKCLRSELRK